MTSKIRRLLLGTIVAGIGLAGDGPARGDMVYAPPATGQAPEAGDPLASTVIDPLRAFAGADLSAVAATPGAASLLVGRPEGADLFGPGALDPTAGPTDLAAALASSGMGDGGHLADDPNSWDIDPPGALGPVVPAPGAARTFRRPGPPRAGMDVLSSRVIVVAEPPTAVLLGVGIAIVAPTFRAQRHRVRHRPIAGAGLA